MFDTLERLIIQHIRSLADWVAQLDLRRAEKVDIVLLIIMLLAILPELASSTLISLANRLLAVFYLLKSTDPPPETLKSENALPFILVLAGIAIASMYFIRLDRQDRLW